MFIDMKFKRLWGLPYHKRSSLFLHIHMLNKWFIITNDYKNAIINQFVFTVHLLGKLYF
jgi:hypothetical protein